jgi:hypothetical protein
MVLKFSFNLKFRVKKQIVYTELQNTLINNFTFGVQKIKLWQEE